jgi:hypothetical protein
MVCILVRILFCFTFHFQEQNLSFLHRRPLPADNALVPAPLGIGGNRVAYLGELKTALLAANRIYDGHAKIGTALWAGWFHLV